MRSATDAVLTHAFMCAPADSPVGTRLEHGIFHNMFCGSVEVGYFDFDMAGNQTVVVA